MKTTRSLRAAFLFVGSLLPAGGTVTYAAESHRLAANAHGTAAAACGGEGLAFSPFRDGQDPNLGLLPTISEIVADLRQMQSVTCRIRTYRASGPFEDAIRQAHHLGLRVTAGALLGNNTATNEAEIAAVLRLANEGALEAVVIGNETQLLGTVPEAMLVSYLDRVRAALPATVPVSTAEPWDLWIARRHLADHVDFVMIHVHPFWQRVRAEEASAYVLECLARVRAQFTGQEVVIGETGWPSGGSSSDAGVPREIVPSPGGEERFVRELRPAAAAAGVTYFLHEAYDQEFKWRESIRSGVEGPPALPLARDLSGRYPGSSWGVFAADGRLKPFLAALFPFADQSPSRDTRVVFDNRGLAAFYDMGVDSSRQRRDWLSPQDGAMRLAYPADQAWGAVFVTVGRGMAPPRPWKDFSSFASVCVDLRGEVGGEQVLLGLKDATDADDGSETRVEVSLGASWATYCAPLSAFRTANLARIYVPLELVFEGPLPATVYLRRVAYQR